MVNEELVQKLVPWIREKVLAAGCKGVVLGMSGGIDSSVLAVLCRRAFPENTLGVIMPCYSCAQDKEHALMVAQQFSIPTTEIALDGVLDNLLKVLPHYQITSSGDSRLPQANLKARCRMIALYYIANQLKYMVAGSTNRSELEIGYFTKYGDGGVDIMPLAGLVKKEIRELARFLDIPESIVAKPPSGGLWEGQTDEDEMGFTYDELDRYLLTAQAQPVLKEKIERMVSFSAHKHALPPVARFTTDCEFL